MSSNSKITVNLFLWYFHFWFIINDQIELFIILFEFQILVTIPVQYFVCIVYNFKWFIVLETYDDKSASAPLITTIFWNWYLIRIIQLFSCKKPIILSQPVDRKEIGQDFAFFTWILPLQQDIFVLTRTY